MADIELRTATEAVAADMDDADIMPITKAAAGSGLFRVKLSTLKAWFLAGIGSGAGLPPGGTAGQVLTKIDGTDGNADWETPAAGGGGGGGGSPTTAPTVVQSAFGRVKNGNLDVTLPAAPTPGNVFVAIWTGAGGNPPANLPANFTIIGFLSNENSPLGTYKTGFGATYQGAYAAMCRVRAGDGATITFPGGSDVNNFALFEVTDFDVAFFTHNRLQINGTNFIAKRQRPAYTALDLAVVEQDGNDLPAVTSGGAKLHDFNESGYNHVATVLDISNAPGDILGTFPNAPAYPMVAFLSLAKSGNASGGGGGSGGGSAAIGAHRYWEFGDLQPINNGSALVIGEMLFYDTAGTQHIPTSQFNYVGDPNGANVYDGGVGGAGGNNWDHGYGAGAWIAFDFGTAVEMGSFTYKHRQDYGGGYQQSPARFALRYSDDAITWYDVPAKLEARPPYTDNNDTRTFTVPQTAALGGGGGGSSLYRFGGFFTTTPAANEVVMMHVATDAFSLRAALAGARVNVGTNPSADTAFTLNKNGAAAGTITISAAGAVTLATTGGAAIAVAAGDLLTLVAPAAANGIANTAFTLRGA